MNIRKGAYETIMLSIHAVLIAWCFVFGLSLGGAIPMIIAAFDTGFNLYAVSFYALSWIGIFLYKSLDDADSTIESVCDYIAKVMKVKY